MHITLVTQHYPPEIGAPQVRLSSLAEHWVKLGHEVTVLTAVPNHPTGVVPSAYRNRLLVEEKIGGVKIVRHWLWATPNEGVIKRSISHASFMLSAACLSLFRGPRPDVIVASSPTFLPVLSAWLMAKVRRSAFVFEVRDLWPGIFVELGILKEGVLLRVLYAVELFLYRQAAVVVTVTRGFAKKIAARGIHENKIFVVPNGADMAEPLEMDGDFRARFAGPDEFVVLYLGAIGLSHGIDVALRGAKRLRDRNVRFLFLGEGAKKAELQAWAAEEGLGHVTFLPGRERREALKFYAIADVCLVSHKNIAGFKDFIPSKMFEIMAHGKPIVAAVQGESAEILEKSGAARVISPGDPEALAKAVEGLMDQQAERERMGLNGLKYVQAHYSRQKLAEAYAEILQSASARKGRA